MRDVVRKLWENILNPFNDERELDLISFFTLVVNGQITEDEFKEIMKGQQL